MRATSEALGLLILCTRCHFLRNLSIENGIGAFSERHYDHVTFGPFPDLSGWTRKTGVVHCRRVRARPGAGRCVVTHRISFWRTHYELALVACHRRRRRIRTFWGLAVRRRHNDWVVPNRVRRTARRALSDRRGTTVRKPVFRPALPRCSFWVSLCQLVRGRLGHGLFAQTSWHVGDNVGHCRQSSDVL